MRLKSPAILFIAATLVLNAVSANPVLAQQTGVTSPAVCNEQSYLASIKSAAKPVLRWVNLSGVNLRIPTSVAWKVENKTLPRFEKSSSEKSGIGQYYFGIPMASAETDCEYVRQYDLRVTVGKSFAPGFSPYAARFERIGNNSVAIFSTTGDTDCPSEHAVVFVRGKVVEFQKTCSALDAASRAIIASIN
jgi:hypothetical protein